jgi:predicted O-methyltransferase YrrM
MTSAPSPDIAASMSVPRGDLATVVDEAFALGVMQLREEILALCGLLRCLPIRNVLEIGAGQGGTFYLWCKLFGSGFKLSVDLAGGPYGGEPNADPAVLSARNLMMLAWSPSAHVITGDSRDPLIREEVTRLLGDDRLHLLFIDGNHTYDAVKQDFENFRGLVAPGGCVVFHDINDSEFHRANDVGVARLWSEIPGRKLEITCRDTWGGIGVLWVE